MFRQDPLQEYMYSGPSSSLGDSYVTTILLFLPLKTLKVTSVKRLIDLLPVVVVDFSSILLVIHFHSQFHKCFPKMQLLFRDLEEN